MMTMSSHQRAFSTYSMSYLIHSWKSLPARRVRRICHRPVMPGRTLNRASRHGGQNWFSLYGLGRGPTIDMSPHQHVPELRQLVEIVLAQHLADAREARIVLDVELRAVGLVQRFELRFDLLGVLAHRAELQAGELASADGLAAMREEERPAVLQPDRQHDERIKRQRAEDREKREDVCRNAV